MRARARAARYLRALAARGALTLLEQPSRRGFAAARQPGVGPARRPRCRHSAQRCRGRRRLARSARAARGSERGVGVVAPFTNAAARRGYPLTQRAEPLPAGHTVATLDALFARPTRDNAVALPAVYGPCIYFAANVWPPSGPSIGAARLRLRRWRPTSACARRQRGFPPSAGRRRVRRSRRHAVLRRRGATNWRGAAGRRWRSCIPTYPRAGRGDVGARSGGVRSRAASTCCASPRRRSRCCCSFRTRGAAASAGTWTTSSRSPPGAATCSTSSRPPATPSSSTGRAPAKSSPRISRCPPNCRRSPTRCAPSASRGCISTTFTCCRSAILDLPAAVGVPYDCTLHDYFAICPQYHLVTEDGRYCGEPERAGCAACLARRPGQWGLDIVAWRGVFGAAAARRRPRDRAVARRRAADRATTSRISPSRYGRIRNRRRRRVPRIVRVAVLGNLSPEKGLRVVAACATDAESAALPLAFRVHRLDDRAGAAVARGAADDPRPVRRRASLPRCSRPRSPT